MLILNFILISFSTPSIDLILHITHNFIGWKQGERKTKHYLNVEWTLSNLPHTHPHIHKHTYTYIVSYRIIWINFLICDLNNNSYRFTRNIRNLFDQISYRLLNVVRDKCNLSKLKLRISFLHIKSNDWMSLFLTLILLFLALCTRFSLTFYILKRSSSMFLFIPFHRKFLVFCIFCFMVFIFHLQTMKWLWFNPGKCA